MSVLASEAAPDGFDARRDAISRTYRYRLFTRREPSPFEHLRALHHPQPIDEQARTLAGQFATLTEILEADDPADAVRFMIDDAAERLPLSAVTLLPRPAMVATLSPP
ncbi:MAG TPA: hypothetical protein PKB03_09195, partial [Baekduia sp.]|nr:hypothetical protein [Baekduia sp.]